MDKTNLKVAVVSALLCCLLAGCAHHPWLYVDDSRASVLIVRGYIASGVLNRSECYEVSEEAVCGIGLPSDVTFVVEQSLVGTPARKRLPVQVHYTGGWPELVKGPRAQYVAVILTDGEVSELHGVESVVRTVDGKWAIPIKMQDDAPQFPCSREDIPPERLRFQPPGPRESFDDVGFDESDAESLKDDDGYTVKDGYVYANKGVLLDHATTVYAGKPAAAVEGACRY